MIEELVNEYVTRAEAASAVNYSDKKSVRQFNGHSDRMRAIVKEIVALGREAVARFIYVLDNEPAADWAAHHLVEMAELDSATLLKCFERVKRAKAKAEERGDLANAMGERMWLSEWQAKKP